MKKHIKKMIAPTVIVILMVLYIFLFALPFLFVPELPLVARILGLVIPVALIGVSVFVFVERIEEIRSGQEDDLSQY